MWHEETIGIRSSLVAMMSGVKSWLGLLGCTPTSAPEPPAAAATTLDDDARLGYNGDGKLTTRGEWRAETTRVFDEINRVMSTARAGGVTSVRELLPSRGVLRIGYHVGYYAPSEMDLAAPTFSLFATRDAACKHVGACPHVGVYRIVALLTTEGGDPQNPTIIMLSVQPVPLPRADADDE